MSLMADYIAAHLELQLKLGICELFLKAIYVAVVRVDVSNNMHLEVD